MRAHCLQHVESEGPAYIAEWLESAGWEVAYTRQFAGDALPEPSRVDLLVVMGGPMGANDDATVPWLAVEVAFVRAVIDAGIPVLGVCLGGQIVARALGACVRRNAEPEIGWFPVRAVRAEHDGVFTFPAEQLAFHWHGDTFEIPEGAIRLAESDACANQAFQYGERVIALQCHLEITPLAATVMTHAFGEHLVPGAHVQSADEILGAECIRYAAANALLGQLLSYLVRTKR